MRITILIVILVLAILLSLTSAGVPLHFSYQGTLLDGSSNPVPDGQHLVQFVIWDDEFASGAANEKWNSGLLAIDTYDGLFSVLLGSDPNNPLDPFVFAADSALWLGVTVSGEPEMSPRTMFSSVPFAIFSRFAQNALEADAAYSSQVSDLATNVPDNLITTSKIENGTIMLEDINPNSASAGQIIKWDGSAWIVADDETGTGAGWNWSDSSSYGPDSVYYADSAQGVFKDGVATEAILNGTILPEDVDDTQLQRRVTGTAPSGEFITAINQDGSVVTAVDQTGGGGGDYVKRSGDTLHGSLYMDDVPGGSTTGRLEVGTGYTNLELGETGTTLSKLWGQAYGELNLFDKSADQTVRLSSGDASGGELELYNNAGEPTHYLGGQTFALKTGGLYTTKIFANAPPTGGVFTIQDEDGQGLILMNANNSGGGQLQLQDATGSSSIRLFGNYSGDNSVLFPDDAVNSDEMLNEPGIASNTTTTSYSASHLAMGDVVTVDLEIPSAGYILVTADAAVKVYDGSTLMLQIDETAGGTGVGQQVVRFEVQGSSGFGYRFTGLSRQRVYYKSVAGSYTFRLEAQTTVSSTGAVVDNAKISAIFIPTSYGAVTTVASSPGDHPEAEAIQVPSDPNDPSKTETVYKMDLRYYELKAKEAQLKARAAELAALKAERDLREAEIRQQEVSREEKRQDNASDRR